MILSQVKTCPRTWKQDNTTENSGELRTAEDPELSDTWGEDTSNQTAHLSSASPSSLQPLSDSSGEQNTADLVVKHP